MIMEDLQVEINNWCTALKDYLKCEQCQKELTEDIYLCEAGHLICVGCIQNVTSNRLCSVCKMPYTRTRNYLAENLAGKMNRIIATLKAADDKNDDVRSVCSESSVAFAFPCWIMNCRFRGSIEEIRQHSKDNHGLLYVNHLDGILPYMTAWVFDYAFPRVLDRLIDVENLGLFLLHIVIYDNGALRAHIFMYQSGRMAKKYKYQLKIECCGTNMSVEADVDSSRIPKNALGAKGLFISRGSDLQNTLQNAKKFTCSLVIDRTNRNKENPGDLQENKQNKAKKYNKNSRNHQSTSELNQISGNASKKDTNGEAKHFQQNRNKSKTEKRDKAKNVKPPNTEAKDANGNEKCTKTKFVDSQTHSAKVSNSLQTTESVNTGKSSPSATPSQSVNQKPRSVNSPATSSPVTPTYSNAHQTGYQVPPAAYQSPSYHPSAFQQPPFNPHISPPPQHFTTPPPAYHGVNQMQSLGTPPCTQHCSPSAPVEEGTVHRPPVQYPDLTTMRHGMTDDRLSMISIQINERERMARSTTGTPRTQSFKPYDNEKASKDKCIIS